MTTNEIDETSILKPKGFIEVYCLKRCIEALK